MWQSWQLTCVWSYICIDALKCNVTIKPTHTVSSTQNGGYKGGGNKGEGQRKSWNLLMKLGSLAGFHGLSFVVLFLISEVGL